MSERFAARGKYFVSDPAWWFWYFIWKWRKLLTGAYFTKWTTYCSFYRSSVLVYLLCPFSMLKMFCFGVWAAYVQSCRYPLFPLLWDPDDSQTTWEAHESWQLWQCQEPGDETFFWVPSFPDNETRWYWPLIGRCWSCDLNTGLWLVQTWHGRWVRQFCGNLAPRGVWP